MKAKEYRYITETVSDFKLAEHEMNECIINAIDKGIRRSRRKKGGARATTIEIKTSDLTLDLDDKFGSGCARRAEEYLKSQEYLWKTS